MMSLDEFYIRGDQNVMVPAHLNFGKYVLDNLRKYSDEVALVNSETNTYITYKQFTQYSVDLATSLMDLSVGVGDIVAVGSEKRITFIPTALGIVFTGATYTPLEINGGRSILKNKLSLTKPNYLICSKLFLEKYEDILKSYDFIKTYIVFDETPNWPDVIPIESLLNKNVDISIFEPRTVKGQVDPAIILYSSGTTGISKCIVLTHMNCIVTSNNECFRNKNIKTACVLGEWYHNYDTFMIFKFLTLGVRVAYSTMYTVPEVLECIDKYEANIAMLVPALISLFCKDENLNKYKLDSLKIIYSRSTPLHRKKIEKIKERLPKLQHVMQGYGLTECGEPTSEIWALQGPKPGSIGMASPGTTIKVVDTKTGKILGPNQEGEIRVMGPMFMKGYIQIDSSTYLDEDGFFKTGDMGYYDENKYFFIIDRITDVIVHKGFKFGSLELETILEQHSDIIEAAVVGKPHPDFGQIPTVFVVKKANCSLTKEDIIKYVHVEIASYLDLEASEVIFMEKIPRNPRGKILRQQLREKLNNIS